MTAETYAAALEPGDTVGWRPLEVQAFLGCPRVLKELDPARKYHAKSDVGAPGVRAVEAAAKNTVTVIAVLTLLLGIVVVVFPVAIGLTVLVGGRFGRAPIPVETALPIAGIVFAYQLVVLLVSFALWVRSGRRKDVGRETQAGAAAIFGVIASVVAVVRNAGADGRVWPGWAIIVVVSTAFAVGFTVMLLTARAGAAREPDRAGESATARPTAVEPLRRVRLQVERLPEPVREAIRADLTAAIDDLAARGVIGERDAEWARGAELGKLALRMSQPRRPTPPTSAAG